MRMGCTENLEFETFSIFDQTLPIKSLSPLPNVQFENNDQMVLPDSIRLIARKTVIVVRGRRFKERCSEYELGAEHDAAIHSIRSLFIQNVCFSFGH